MSLTLLKGRLQTFAESRCADEPKTGFDSGNPAQVTIVMRVERVRHRFCCARWIRGA